MSGLRDKQPGSIFPLALLFLFLPFVCISATTWYVDGTVALSGDGLSWQTAKKTIQEAVDSATGGDQIWVAEGLYFGHVTLKSGLSLYGGFSKMESTVEDRDLSVHKTIIDGNGLTQKEIILGTTDIIDGFNTQNSFRGIYGGGKQVFIRNCWFTKSTYSGAELVADLCEIQNCHFVNNVGAEGSALYVGGAGVFRIRNCVFEDNVSNTAYGGPVYFYKGGGEVEMSSCVIRNNTTGPAGDGAGIKVNGHGKVTIDRCVITGNIAKTQDSDLPGTGGGVSGGRGVSITNSIIANNSAYYGGGVYRVGAISNSIIASNTAYNGAGVWSDGDEYQFGVIPVLITNCTFAGNVATGDAGGYDPPGGGIYCHYYQLPYPLLFDPAYLSVTNCIFANNSPSGIRFGSEVYLTPWNNLFHGNAYAAQGPDDNYPTGADLNNLLPGARGNVDGDPAFVDAGAENYHLLRNSAAIDRGTTVGLTADFDGNPRPVDVPGVGADGTGEEFDIGAYEYQGEAPALAAALDDGGGKLGAAWTDDSPTTPALYLGFAFDVYEGQFVFYAAEAGVRSEAVRRLVAGPPEGGSSNGETPEGVTTNGKKRLKASLRTRETPEGGTTNGKKRLKASLRTGEKRLEGASTKSVFASGGGTIWFPFPAAARSGQMDLGLTGAYFAWISSQFPNGAWLACPNPATVILYSGTLHKPAGLSVEDRGGGVWRLHWTPEVYGTWLDQIIVWRDGVGWIETQGPDGFGFWHFVDYGGVAYDPAKASFLNGWADLTLPPGGSYVFFLNFRAWDAATQGEFAIAASP